MEILWLSGTFKIPFLRWIPLCFVVWHSFQSIFMPSNILASIISRTLSEEECSEFLGPMDSIQNSTHNFTRLPAATHLDQRFSSCLWNAAIRLPAYQECCIPRTAVRQFCILRLAREWLLETAGHGKRAVAARRARSFLWLHHPLSLALAPCNLLYSMGIPF